MVKYCIILNFISISVFIGSGLTSSVPDFATLCPYNDFCTTKAKKWIAPTSGTEACCTRCSCATDCHLVGNCCPDSPNKTNSEPIYQCVHMDSILNAPRQVYDRRERKQFFRVIDRCPDRNASIEFPSCENPSKLDDYTIVSNVENEKVFRNRQCAMCHGVTDFIEWDLTASCPELMTTTFQAFEERDEFILKNCWLEPIPPNRHIVELAGCYFDYKLSRGCAPSDVNNWVHDAIGLKKACYDRRPGQNTVYRDAENSVLYSSIYCYLCNNPQQREGPGRCQISQDGSEMTLHEIMIRRLNSFSVVIRKKDTILRRSETTCNRQEMWDSITGSCRALHCPYGSIPFDGTCENVVLLTKGLSVSMTFEVEFLVGNPFVSIRLLSALASQMYGLIDSLSRCGDCNIMLYRLGTSVYVKKAMYTNEKCPVSVLLNTVRNIAALSSNRTVGCGNKEEGYRVRLKFLAENVPDIGAEVINGESVNDICPSEPVQIDFQQLHKNCPRFVMPANELNTIVSSGHAYLDQPGLVSICVDEYKKLFADRKSNGVFWPPYPFIFTLSLIVSALLINI